MGVSRKFRGPAELQTMSLGSSLTFWYSGIIVGRRSGKSQMSVDTEEQLPGLCIAALPLNLVQADIPGEGQGAEDRTATAQASSMTETGHSFPSGHDADKARREPL